jgi:hypothetical protein
MLESIVVWFAAAAGVLLLLSLAYVNMHYDR